MQQVGHTCCMSMCRDRGTLKASCAAWDGSSETVREYFEKDLGGWVVVARFFLFSAGGGKSGVELDYSHLLWAARMPAACPVARQVPMTRTEDSAS